MRTMTWTFLAGAAVGYYLGSRPREQAVSEVRHATGVGLGFLQDRVQQVREAREERHWTDERDWTQARLDDPDSVLNPPAYDLDLETQESGGDSAREDLLDEVGRESFPSSDPPSSWAGADKPFPRGVRQ